MILQQTMQQFITSSEACALLDRILQTSQSLNRVIARCIDIVIATPVVPPPAEASIQPAIVVESAVVPSKERPVTPVLTIKLADLMREMHRGAAEQRRSKTTPTAKHRSRSAYNRTPREVEVIFRRGFRLVS